MLRRFLSFVYEHQILSWLGLIVGIAGLAGAWWQTEGALFGVLNLVGWGLALSFGVGLLLVYLQNPEHPVSCLSCEKHFVLRGTRGAEATHKEVMRFRCNFPTRLFTYSRLRMDGSLEREVIRFRSLGKNGRKLDAPFFALTRGDIAYADPDPQTKLVHLLPPGGLHRGDVFEVELAQELHDTFPADRERVGKDALFPIGSLEFHVQFDRCSIKDCRGTKSINEEIKGFWPLNVTVDENGATNVEWNVTNAKPNELFRLTWYWK